MPQYAPILQLQLAGLAKHLATAAKAVSAGALPALLGALDAHPEENDVKIRGLKALAGLAQCRQLHSDEQEVLLGAVLRALGDFTEDDGVRICALRALAGLAHGGALTTQQVNQQVLGAVLSVLNADFHNSAYDVEASCLEVLRELAPFLRSSPRAAETVRAILNRDVDGPTVGSDYRTPMVGSGRTGRSDGSKGPHRPTTADPTHRGTVCMQRGVVPLQPGR